MKQGNQVLITGAGPVGLILAAFLHKNGVSFRLIDQRSGPVKESRALGVHARTLELLKPLGLDKEFIKLGRITNNMHFHDENRKLFTLKFDCLQEQTPYPYYLILPQTTTERILLRYLAKQGIEVEWETTLTNFEQVNEHVLCQLSSGEIQSEYIFSFVIGCDGANSFVRQHLGIEFEGETYEALFSLAEVEINDAKIETNATHVYMAPQTTCAVIPMPCGKYRIVGPNPNNSGISDFTHFQHFLDSQSLFSEMTLHSPNRVIDYKMHKRIAKQFSKGNIFICGDAAHIHSPAGGQGMNTGMQDAINLAWKIAAVLQKNFPDRILSTYSLERRNVSKAVVHNTDRAMTFVSKRGFKNKFLTHFLYPLILKCYQPVDLIAAMAQLTTRYGYNSSKVGVRFPWLKTLQGDSTLDFIDGCNWILLTFRQTNTSSPYHTETRSLLGDKFRHIYITDNQYFKQSMCHKIDQQNYSMDIPKEWINKSVLLRPDGYIHAISENQNIDSITTSIKKWM
ncbi:FAD-dependent monooxygenase [Vibrio mimicus]